MAARRERVPGDPQRDEPRRSVPVRGAPAEPPRREPAGAYGVPVPWWAVLLQGVVGVLVGLALLVTPAAATVALVQLVGLYWFVRLRARADLPPRPAGGWGWPPLAGALGIAAGCWCPAPALGAVVVPTADGTHAYGIVIGLIHLAGRRGAAAGARRAGRAGHPSAGAVLPPLAAARPAGSWAGRSGRWILAIAGYLDPPHGSRAVTDGGRWRRSRASRRPPQRPLFRFPRPRPRRPARGRGSVGGVDLPRPVAAEGDHQRSCTALHAGEPIGMPGTARPA